MTKKVLLLLALVALGSAATITSKLNNDEDFVEEKLTGFFTSKGKSATDLMNGKFKGIPVMGNLDKDEIVTYRESYLVPPRRILTGSVLVYSATPISATNIKIFFGKSPATIDRVETHYTNGYLVLFSSKADKSKMMTVRFNVQAESWSFRNFVIEADLCSPYCEDCQNNTAVCSSCPANSVMNESLGICQCKTGFKATNIGPLICEEQKANIEYPDLCYLEHVLYLGSNAIKTSINFNAATNNYVITSSFSGMSMPTSTCFAANNTFKVGIKACFNKKFEPQICSLSAAQWVNGKTFQINIAAKDLEKYSFTTSSNTVRLASNPNADNFEYSFEFNYAFTSLSQANYICEGCPFVSIRDHSVKLRVIHFIDLKIAPLKFVTENIRTAEDCNCPFYEKITGKALWYKDNMCKDIKNEVIPTFSLSQDMNFGVIMSKPEMKGRVTIKSLSAECKIDGVNYPIAYSILGQYNGEMNTKVCASSRANVANIK